MSTLYGHKCKVTAICPIREGIFVSGFWDKSLIIWSKFPGCSIYSQQSLTGHTSRIAGIIKMNNSEIVSGEWNGDLRIWNINQGICIRHLPIVSYGINQMKKHIRGEIAISYQNEIIIWGAANIWGNPLKQFRVCTWFSIEFLSGDILLIEGEKRELEFIDYANNENRGRNNPPQTGSSIYIIYTSSVYRNYFCYPSNS